MNNGVNNIEWLTAVSTHPKTSDNDLAVATALILSDAKHPDEIEGLHWVEILHSMGRLEYLGFLVRRIDTDTESIYELTTP